MKMIKKICFFVFLFCFMMTIPMGLADDGDSYYRLHITDALYDDLDNDGTKDDIYVDYFIKKNSKNDDEYYKKYSNYYLKVKLILPSGIVQTYWYQLDIECDINHKFESRVNLYNNVTESGWYTAELTLYFRYQRVAKDDIYFDPPVTPGFA